MFVMYPYRISLWLPCNLLVVLIASGLIGVARSWGAYPHLADNWPVLVCIARVLEQVMLQGFFWVSTGWTLCAVHFLESV